mmetsp:Transcript_62558/g.177674  ORF Transcript_62558/g.177674 Transcript_62558/m.177674 type:complete len:210 (-) Transcript_62558:967-1596(-)
MHEPPRRRPSSHRVDDDHKPLCAQRRRHRIQCCRIGGAPAARLLLAGLLNDTDCLTKRFVAAVGEVDTVVIDIALINLAVDNRRAELQGAGDATLGGQLHPAGRDLTGHWHEAAFKAGPRLAVRHGCADLPGSACITMGTRPASIGPVVSRWWHSRVQAVAGGHRPLQLLARVRVSGGARGGHSSSRVGNVAANVARGTCVDRRALGHV